MVKEGQGVVARDDDPIRLLSPGWPAGTSREPGVPSAHPGRARDQPVRRPARGDQRFLHLLARCNQRERALRPQAVRRPPRARPCDRPTSGSGSRPRTYRGPSRLAPRRSPARRDGHERGRSRHRNGHRWRPRAGPGTVFKSDMWLARVTRSTIATGQRASRAGGTQSRLRPRAGGRPQSCPIRRSSPTISTAERALRSRRRSAPGRPEYAAHWLHSLRHGPRDNNRQPRRRGPAAATACARSRSTRPSGESRVTVVDSGSTDSTPEMVEREFPGCG